MGKIKAIIFDADGMVINSPEMFGTWYQKNKNLSSETMLAFFKGVFQDCLIGKADLKKSITPFLKDWKWEESVDEFLNAWFKFEDRINKDVAELIKKLRSEGVKCYLATNQEKYRTDYIRNEMGFSKLFDKIYSSAEVGYKKPEKEFFEFILRDLNIDPGSVMFWDDDEKNVLTAREEGLDSYIFKNINDFKEKIK